MPIGLASFEGDLKSIRRFVDRDHENVASWHEYERGGHYAAHQAPDLFVADIRDFYRGLRRPLGRRRCRRVATRWQR
ncbi:MAG: hypothetical protein GEV28_20965 [Actinophytocola sp.]|uniref:hypothetical protein n=1 Tax=Actinophytocola sp. TaxID=1872138 RepID=UPI001322BBFB|nr:hypothetical protein [Actinophytocola sp.]MPZ82735.1 hypothetical protein [Actinophytocola sp.]